MIIDNIRIKKLLIAILICTILLSICIMVDSADETITVKDQQKPQNISGNMIMVNGTYVVTDEEDGWAKTDGKVYTEKPKYPTVTMTGRPSCTRCVRNHRAYKWSTHTYVDYCPNCHHYNCLINKHKWGSVHEKEFTCKYCDSDFCVVCGKEKYSWSSKELRKI